MYMPADVYIINAFRLRQVCRRRRENGFNGTSGEDPQNLQFRLDRRQEYKSLDVFGHKVVRYRRETRNGV